VTGAGGAFSNGGDVKLPPARGEGALSPATRLEWGQRIIARLMRLPIPVFAAVEGGAFGIGWSLALACDIVIASETAKFGAPFVDFGLNPDGGAAWFLTQRLGRHRASELLLSSRTIEAGEAHALGLVSRLSKPGGALADALAMADGLGKGNRHAVELTKRLVHCAENSDLAATHALELAYCSILQRGDELARATAAFAAASAARKKE
jgi:enoyl-CoA hydratase/carnithine racemase